MGTTLATLATDPPADERVTPMPSTPPKFRLHPITWVGLAINILGSAPLSAVMAASKLGIMDDPNPNPIGLGILTALTFWPGIIIALIGLVLSVVNFRRARSSNEA